MRGRRPIPDRIYLDHAATSPLRPEAKAAMEEGFRIWANPSSPHAEGRAARAALEDARERIKAALGWDGELIFTSGASEALWLALNRAKVGQKRIKRRIVSAVEHDAVFRAAPDAEVVPVDPHGVLEGDLDFSALSKLLASGDRAALAVQHINSETGFNHYWSTAPIFMSAAIEAGALLIADCSQSAGKYPLPNVDMIVVSAHKFGGPIGIGALLVREFNLLEPIGGHERGYRQGTENLPAAMGMMAALEAGGLDDWPTSSDDRAEFHRRLSAYGRSVNPGGWSNWIISVAHPTLSAQALLIRLDAMGFAVSAGSACSSGTLKKSRVLDAFGIDDDTASRTIRVSIGWNTTPEDLDKFAEAWKSLA